jgi:hypothetical protein
MKLCIEGDIYFIPKFHILETGTVKLSIETGLSDLTKFGFGDLDFGLGRAVYGGPPKVGPVVFPEVMGILIAYEDGIIAPVSLPRPAMGRFVEEMGKLLRAPVDDIAAAAGPRSRDRIGKRGQ